jgi:hypothetical protein
VVEEWTMETHYKNKNRGYQQLRVWHDAMAYWIQTARLFREFPFELKKVASQQLASVDSVHRNIAEGYCRRSLKEYLRHLYIALGSLGESVSGLIACSEAGQLTKEKTSDLDSMAFKLENGLLKLVESLERKEQSGDWIDSLIVKECNAVYDSSPQQSIAPISHDSTSPSLHHSAGPTVAIIGASADKAKYSNKSIHAHRKAGYDVYPVNPKEEMIEGLKCYKSVLDIPVALDRVSLYLPPMIGVKILDDVAKKGCKELWVNPGAESPELMEKASALGLNAIYACSYLDANAHG